MSMLALQSDLLGVLKGDPHLEALLDVAGIQPFGSIAGHGPHDPLDSEPFTSLTSLEVVFNSPWRSSHLADTPKLVSEVVTMWVLHR